MKNTINVMRNNSAIANEFIKYGTITPHVPPKYFRKKELPENRTRRKANERYEYRSNQCPTCFTSISNNGTCMCE